MKYLLLSAIALLAACGKEHKAPAATDAPTKAADTTIVVAPDTIAAKTYANERFRGVTVEKTAARTFRVKGEAQIFEANFNWVVEDGHNELKSGFAMTDAGAPEWGVFDFTVDVERQEANTTLTLLLFESSAEDGRRVHELPIPLP